MIDTLEHHNPINRTCIDVNDRWELRYWTHKFDCTPDQLKEAVKSVGVLAENVQKHLRKQ
jgi:hypothetical protein